MNFAADVTAIAGTSGAWCPSLSPTGDLVAYICDRSGSPRVEIASTAANSSEMPITVSGPEQESISVSWSPDGQWLTYLVSPGGSIRAELHAVRPDGTDRRLLAGGGEFETVLAGTWTSVAGRYAFSMADGVGPDATVWFADVPAGTVEILPGSMGLGFCVVTSVSSDGRTIVVRSGPRGQRRLLLLDVDGDEKALPLLHRDFPAGAESGEDGRFAPGGRSVYLRTSAGRDRIALVKVPLDEQGRPGSMEVVAEHDEADVESYAITSDGRVVLVWNVDGQSVCGTVDLTTKAMVRVYLPEPVMPGWSLHPDGNSMVVEVTGPTAPRSLYHLSVRQNDDRRTRDGRRLAGMPETRLPDTVVFPELRRYRSADGLELAGWLYRAERVSGPGPTVVSFHGGPESQERPGFSLLTQSLVAAGLTVFAPNVRGSSGYGSRFMAADDGPARPDSFQDVPATVDFLVGEGIAEAGSIGVQGWSYGGYLVLTALAMWPDLFAAGSTHAGMSDLLSFFAETEPWMAAASVTEYGDPVEHADLLRALSPLTHLEKVRSPTLLVHGDRDTNVPVSESIRAHIALKSAGVATELLLLPGEGHTIVGADHRVELALTICEWFVHYLVRP
jgi:dipeptidyl aminopeptidase/acylaminoacyl peptidase